MILHNRISANPFDTRTQGLLTEVSMSEPPLEQTLHRRGNVCLLITEPIGLVA